MSEGRAGQGTPSLPPSPPTHGAQYPLPSAIAQPRCSGGRQQPADQVQCGRRLRRQRPRRCTARGGAECTDGNPSHEYQWQEDGTTGNFSRVGTARLPPGVTEIIGGGTTSLVGRLEDGNVLKYPIVAGEPVRDLDVETAIYEGGIGHASAHHRLPGPVGARPAAGTRRRSGAATGDGQHARGQMAVGATDRRETGLSPLAWCATLRPPPGELAAGRPREHQAV